MAALWQVTVLNQNDDITVQKFLPGQQGECHTKSCLYSFHSEHPAEFMDLIRPQERSWTQLDLQNVKD